MPDKPLTEDEVLLAALAAVEALSDVERVTDVSFGRFAASIGGGCYWSVSSSRMQGNTQTAGKGHYDLADGRAKERASVVREWRKRLVENDADG